MMSFKTFVRLIPILAIFVFLSHFSYRFYKKLPDASDLESCLIAKMNKVDLCPQSSGYIKIDEVPDLFIQALLISEDAGFYGHNGVDWNEIKASFKENLTEGRLARGGSTITQQLVKNVFLSRKKTFERKLREYFLAKRVEYLYSKKFILEKYINVIELGPGLYGVEAASWNYFGKSARDLNLLESCYLVSLLPNPKVYSKTFKKGKLSEYLNWKINNLLGKLKYYGKINESQWARAKSNVSDFPWKSHRVSGHIFFHSLGEDQAGPVRNYKAKQKQHAITKKYKRLKMAF